MGRGNFDAHSLIVAIRTHSSSESLSRCVRFAHFKSIAKR
jgi:hypothetical protein